MIWIIVAAVTVIVVIGALVLNARQRRVNDGVDSFRRQIDALSPEARRPVIDQVQKQTDADDTVDETHDAQDDPDGA